MYKKLISMFLLAAPMFSFAQELTIDEQIEEKFKPFADAVSEVVFYPISIAGIDVPIVVILLLSGAFFFTLYFKFSNITLLGVAIRATNGKYDEVDHNSQDDISEEDLAGSDGDEVVKIKGVVGEVTHFQALTAALSATVGLGNIAGVAVAIAIGGPGATVWMILAGFLGMST
ncbi:MAG: AGCS family alanine or glycine:cation symporter, partial [Polaribacter sp.]